MERIRRWWPLVALLALAFNLRPVAVSVSPVLVEITADLHLDGFTAGVLTSLPTLCFAVFGALAPAIGRRLGDRRAIAFALVALVAGQVGRILVNSAAAFLALSTLALAGMALGNVLLPSLVRQHYPHRVGLVTAAYSFVLSAGLTLASAATVPLANAAGGWRGAFAVGVCLAVSALVIWLPMQRYSSPSTHTSQRVSLTQIARTRLGWAMALFFGLQSAIAYSIFGWLPSVYRSAGMAQEPAGLMLGIATGVAIAPAFLFPVIVARVRNPSPLFLVLVACLVAGLVGLWLTPMRLPWLWAVLLALGTSAFPMILALFGTRARTPAATTALSGFAQSIGYGIAAIGPLTMGILHEITGGWSASLWTLLVVAVPMTLVGLYSCRPHLIEDELSVSGTASSSDTPARS